MTIKEPCEDLISKSDILERCQLVIDYGFSDKNGYHTVSAETIMRTVKQLPSIKPRQKTGHWIEQDNGNMLTYHRYKCSVCGGKKTFETGNWIQIHDCKWNYCPDCGAKMTESEGNK